MLCPTSRKIVDAEVLCPASQGVKGDCHQHSSIVEYGFLSYLHLCAHFSFFSFAGPQPVALVVAHVANKMSIASQQLGAHPKFIDGISFSHQDLYVCQFSIF
jgi:hypothetical protein